MKSHHILIALIVSTTSTSIAQQMKWETFGKGLQIISADSASKLKISARIQNLVIADQNIKTGGATEINAMVRRARLKFDGYAFSPRVVYKIELGLSNRDISSKDDAVLVHGAPKIIYDAVIKYKLYNSSSLWFGQTKLPGNRERVISSQKLQFVDRSIVNGRFNIDRDFGVQLHNSYEVGQIVIKPILSISLGEGRDVTIVNTGGFNYTGRIEFLPFGEFTNKGDYYSSDLARESTPKLSVAYSYDFNQATMRQSGQLGKVLYDTSGNFLTTDLTTMFADMIFKYSGFSALFEAAYRTSADPTISDASGLAFNNGFGYTGQIGYLFKSNYELASRYSRVSPISGYSTAFTNTEQYTLGLSKYFVGHDLKLQTDLTYERSGYGTFANENLILRLQTELSF